MDIEIIIKKTLVFAGLLASVLAIVILPTLLIQEYFFRTASFGGRMFGLTISGIIIILTMRRIETFLINITDKYLFQKKYDYKELLRTFTAEVLTVLEMDRLLDLTVDKLTDIIKINSSAVLLLDEEKQKFNVMASQGIKDAEVTLVRPDGIVTFLEQTHGYLLVKELKEKKIFIPPTIQEIIEKLNAELIIPMILHEDVIGILSLGKKKSDEEYTQDDLDIILPLARTLAIAISNAKLFVELGKTQAEAAQREKMAAIGTLAAGMAHEIRNPITTIRTFADYLPEKVNDKEFIERFKRLIPKEIDRVENIARSLLEFSHAETSNYDESIYIAPIMQTILSLLQPQYNFFEIRVDCNIDPEAGITGNRGQIQEAIFNILQYVFSETPKNGTIEIATDRRDNRLEINIKDRNLYISDYIIKDVIEPVSRFSGTRRGFALNLFVAKQLIDKNGGTFLINSSRQDGTTITAMFPYICGQFS